MPVPTRPVAPRLCPRCDTALAHEPLGPPWCPACEWNLAAIDPAERRRRAVARRHARAFELNARSLAQFRRALPGRPSTTGSRALLVTASVVLLLVDVGFVAGGVWLLLDGPGLARVLGVPLVLLGIECRPRFSRLGDDDIAVSRRDAPALWSLVDAAGRALDAPTVDVLVLCDRFNAYCGRSGLRRRTVLGIGVPLWAALGPGGRTALLGHELGHLVNGDPTTGFTTQPALTTSARLAGLFDPRGLFRRTRTGMELFAAPLVWVVFAPLNLLFRWLHAGLVRAAARDRQRAEIYADALAVRLGGTEGARELARVLLFQDSVRTALRRAVSAGAVDVGAWRVGVRAALDRRAADLSRAQHLSLRHDASRVASHPPAGLRCALVECWPVQDPTPLPGTDLAAIDAELAPHYATTVRALRNEPLTG